MDKIITVLSYRNFITEMSYAPYCKKTYILIINIFQHTHVSNI